MAAHQNDETAIQLWNYFRSVTDWIQAIFPKTRKEMKGLPWGLLYNEHGQRADLNAKELEVEIQKLMGDEDVTKKSGIYEYLLGGDERKLSIRSFDRRDALAAYEKQEHAPYVVRNLNLKKCRPTTLRPGAKAAKPFPKIAKCSVRNAMS